MASKIYLIDIKNSKYEFHNNGDVVINNKVIGKGRLVTPIKNISLRNIALFFVNGKKYSTSPLKGCMVDD